MDKRAVLAIVLSLIVVFTWQMFFAPKPVKRGEESAQKETTVADKKQTEREAAGPETAKQPVKSSTVASPATPTIEKYIPVETPLYSAIFSTRGGALKSFRLKGYRQKLDRNSEPIEMVHISNGMPYPLSSTFPESNIDIRPDSSFSVDVNAVDLMKTKDSRRLTFSLTHPGSIKLEKTYTFHPDKFAFDLEIKVYNLTRSAINQSALLSWHQFVDPKQDTDSYVHEGPISFMEKSIERYEIKKMEPTNLLGPDVAWGGFENKYFIASIIPQNPTLTSILLSKDDRSLVSVGMKGTQSLIPQDQSMSFGYTLYVGPKDHDILKTEKVGLENAIDFGSWLKWLAMPLLVCLKFLYKYVHNYGIAIIILTILIKIIFWPLGNKSYKSMKEMQKLQPKIIELREKYKDDKARIGQETMALYKSHKVNPLGGCLPMLIQIPVFFGLYKALMYAIELRHSPFYWWIQDLSEKDPYYITPLIMGATMFIQQKMSPPAGDPMQQKIMLIMPVIFTFMFLNFPSGLVIYWLFQNILSIGQQYYINKLPY